GIAECGLRIFRSKLSNEQDSLEENLKFASRNSKFLLSLIKRIPALAVEVAQVLSLDEVKAPRSDSTEQIDYLLMRDGRAFGLRHKTTAPMIRAESFRLAARPNFNAAIADHYQLQTVAGDFNERGAQVIG